MMAMQPSRGASYPLEDCGLGMLDRWSSMREDWMREMREKKSSSLTSSLFRVDPRGSERNKEMIRVT